MKTIIFFTVLLLYVTIFSCTARRSEPLKGSLVLTSEEAIQGRILFMEHCHKCHPMGESGLGPSIVNNPSPQFMKRFQVRHGLGVMPSFKPDEISRKELRMISAYLRCLQKN